MGELILANKSDFVALADTIRAKTGSTDQMSFVSGFINGINSIENGSAIETCVLTCTRDSSPAPGDVVISYIDNTFRLKTQTIPQGTTYITLIKGSIIHVNSLAVMSSWSSELARIDDNYTNGTFFVSGNGTINIILG